MPQRRLLLLVTDLERGGTPTVVRELALRLTPSPPHPHIDVACLATPGPVAEEIAAAGITVTAFSATSRFDPRVFSRLHHLVKQHQIDTVLSFLVHANVVAAAVSIFHPEIRWLQSIQTTQPWPAWHWIAQRIAAISAESVVVPSRSVAVAAHHWSGIELQKLIIIPNAIDLDEFAHVQPATEDTHPLPIVFIGRLDPIKDVPTLVEAVSRLKGEVHLNVYGEGPDRPRIERAIADHAAQNIITLHGSIASPAEALQGKAMLVLPSLAEGFGLVLIEAMAAGVPVIATDVAGIRDVVETEVTGLLVPPADIGSLAGAIHRLATDPTLRRRLATNALDHVRRTYTWAQVLPKYQRWLEG